MYNQRFLIEKGCRVLGCGIFFCPKKFQKPIDNIIKVVYYVSSALRQRAERRMPMDFSASTPIYLQVVEDIKRQLMSGELQPGEKLWSARDMALRYQINPNTAARVYKELEMEQLCYTKRGLGTYLTEEPGIAEKLRKEKAEQMMRTVVKELTALGYTKEELYQLLEMAF